MSPTFKRWISLVILPCLLAEPVCSAGTEFLSARAAPPVSDPSLVTTQALAEIALTLRERHPMLLESPILRKLFKVLTLGDLQGVREAPLINFFGTGTVFSLVLANPAAAAKITWGVLAFYNPMAAGLLAAGVLMTVTIRSRKKTTVESPGEKSQNDKRLLNTIFDLGDKRIAAVFLDEFYSDPRAAQEIARVLSTMFQYPGLIRRDQRFKKIKVEDIQATAGRAVVLLAENPPQEKSSDVQAAIATQLITAQVNQMKSEPWAAGPASLYALTDSAWFQKKWVASQAQNQVHDWLKTYRSKVVEELQAVPVETLPSYYQDLDPTVREVAEELYRAGILPTLPATPIMALPAFLKNQDVAVRSAARELLYDRYRGTSERTAIREYLVCRYLFETLAGTSFHVLEESDFIQQAHTSLLDYIAHTHQESSLFQIGLHHKIRYDLAIMVAGHWGLSNKVMFDAISDLRQSILNPVRVSRDPLRLSREEVEQELGIGISAEGPLVPKPRARKQPRWTVAQVIEVIQNHGMATYSSPPALEDQAPTPEELAAINEHIDVQNNIMLSLTPQQEKVIRLRFALDEGDEMTLDEVGRMFAVTRERIRQIEAKALRRLRHPSRSSRLQGVLSTGWLRKRTRFLDILKRARPVFLNVSPTELASPEPRAADLTEREKDNLWDLAIQGLSPEKRQLIPMALQRNRTPGHGQPVNMSEAAREIEAQVTAHFRLLWTLGLLDPYGTDAEVRQSLIEISREKTQRLLQNLPWAGIMEAAQYDEEVAKEFVREMYPGLFPSHQVTAYLRQQKKIQQAQAPVQLLPSSEFASHVLNAGRRIAAVLAAHQTEHGRRVLARILKDMFYPVMRRDEETLSQEGLKALGDEADRPGGDRAYQASLRSVHQFYTQARASEPRGFREETVNSQSWPLTPAQKYGIWQGVRSLQNPLETCAIFTSDARVGKTIMALLAAFNIRKDRGAGDYAVRKVLYTTGSHEAQHEVAQEIHRRTNLGIKTFILEGPRAKRLKAIQDARAEEGPVVVIANYESVRDLAQEITGFAPDAHIIDEINRLRRGEATVRAPIIFGIPAAYRIGVGARLVEVRREDIAAILSWARKQAFPKPESLQNMSADHLFVALDEVSVRWRRRVVYPEVGDPKEDVVYVPYDDIQEDLIWKIRSDSAAGREKYALPAGSDSGFGRLQEERLASIHPGFVLSPETLIEQGLDPETYRSPKIQKMDEDIENELRQNGKVLVFVDFIEGGVSNYLVKHLNNRFGPHAAAAVSGRTPAQTRIDIISGFRSQDYPKILIATPYLLGSSVNLFQVPGTPFHTSLVLRLSQPWWVMDDGERLIGLGQIYPVRVVTYISQFKSHPYATTVEERQLRELAEKQELFESVVDGRPPEDPEFSAQVESVSEFITPKNQSLTKEEDFDTGGIIRSVRDLSWTSLFKHIYRTRADYNRDYRWIAIGLENGLSLVLGAAFTLAYYAAAGLDPSWSSLLGTWTWVSGVIFVSAHLMDWPVYGVQLQNAGLAAMIGAGLVIPGLLTTHRLVLMAAHLLWHPLHGMINYLTRPKTRPSAQPVNPLQLLFSAA